MSMMTSVWIAAALVVGWNAPDDEPAAWKAKREAAVKAIKEGKPIVAETLLTEIVADAEKQYGPDDLRVAGPLEELVVFFMDKHRERYAEAEPLVRRALVIREKTQGTDHPDFAETLIQQATLDALREKKPDERKRQRRGRGDPHRAGRICP